MPLSSRTAAPPATRISVCEFDVLASVVVVARRVVAVVVVGVSALGVASSPNALFPFRPAPTAAGAIASATSAATDAPPATRRTRYTRGAADRTHERRHIGRAYLPCAGR